MYNMEHDLRQNMRITAVIFSYSLRKFYQCITAKLFSQLGIGRDTPNWARKK